MFRENRRIAIVAGGTGGHIYPGIAIAEEIAGRRTRDEGRRTKDEGRGTKDEILFIGSEEGMEKELVPRAGFKIKLIKARALLRKISYQAISAPFVSFFGFFQALRILRDFRPKVLISTGGYVSLPAVLAAKALGIPIFIHEQNVLPGFTNRLLCRFAKKVFLSFEESRRYLDGIVVGNPVRREIIEADREAARRRLGYLPDEFVVLVMGGSQGARKINEVVIDALPLIEERRTKNEGRRTIRIFHIVGERDAKLMEDRMNFKKYDFYRKVDYLYNMADALAVADLVVSRAGATAIAEFLVKGIPMVLLPFPFSAEGHQDLNAQAIVSAGAGVVVRNDDFTVEKFVSLIADKDIDLKRMRENCLKLARPNAAKEIVNAIL